MGLRIGLGLELGLGLGLVMGARKRVCQGYAKV